MSHTHPTASSSSNQASNFQLILINALDVYKKRTKKDLLAHPLVTEIQTCNSPSAILAVLQQQLQGLDQSRRSDERWTRWLDPTVNVIYTLSGTLGEGVGLVRFRSRTCLRYALSYSSGQVFSPAKVIFAGVGVLLSVCIHLLNNFVRVIVILTSLRQRRTFGQAKTLLSTSLSASKCFFAVWMFTHKCRGRTR